ncbi:hypothetical protein GCM10022384_20480 [Streptomyces marokkonensis]|uniref:Uncharacterized protein n=1 Tax=Streptomyces marokkonensis TaxID=324855 RepID=A0ABP7PR56_9ACTN
MSGSGTEVRLPLCLVCPYGERTGSKRTPGDICARVRLSTVPDVFATTVSQDGGTAGGFHL